MNPITAWCAAIATASIAVALFVFLVTAAVLRTPHHHHQATTPATAKATKMVLPLPPLLEIDRFQVIGKALLVKRCPVIPQMDPTGQLCRWRFAEI